MRNPIAAIDVGFLVAERAATVQVAAAVVITTAVNVITVAASSTALVGAGFGLVQAREACVVGVQPVVTGGELA